MSPYSASANAYPLDTPPHNVVTSPGVEQRGSAVSQMQQGLSDGSMSMLQVLSRSAESASAAETEKAKRANSIKGTGSNSNSGGTRSSFEYD